MRRDRTKSILSIIATLISTALILIYWFAPAKETSHPLYKLFIDCIPDSLIVLITVPIVYWLLYTQGLTNMGDCPLFMVHSHAAAGDRHVHSQQQPVELPTCSATTSATKNHVSNAMQDILLVIAAPDAPPKNSDAERVLTPLNATIRIAEARGMIVVLTTCYSPQEPTSEDDGHGSKRRRSPAKVHGGRLLQKVYRPVGSVSVEFCAEPQTPGCSAILNSGLNMIISNPRAGCVYVSGCVSKCCVQAICLLALQHGKKTVALENAIGIADCIEKEAEKLLEDLCSNGVMRQECLTAIPDESVS